MHLILRRRRAGEFTICEASYAATRAHYPLLTARHLSSDTAGSA